MVSLGGYSAHFWLTGGNKSNVDNAIVTFYVDGVAAHTFQPNMAAGTGWVDDQTPCQLGGQASTHALLDPMLTIYSCATPRALLTEPFLCPSHPARPFLSRQLSGKE
jgi:hypothetical protein